MATNTVLTLQNVTKRFSQKEALKQLTLTLNRGECLGFLGPNGAGKTTAIRCIMGFIRPTKGTVKLFGADISGAPPDYKNRIGYLSADNALYGRWTGQQHMNFIASVRGSSLTDANALAQQLSLDTTVKAQHLSSGNKQKLAIIVAFMHNPDLLILDEPTRGLDPLLQETLYGLLRAFTAKGGSVFMSSHNLSEVEKVCSRIVIIRNGELVADEPLRRIKQLKVHTVEAELSRPAVKADLAGKGIELTYVHGTTVRANVQGDLNQFLQKLIRFKVVDVEITHANVEDMFMRYYHDDA